jgi:hypothetical protein
MTQSSNLIPAKQGDPEAIAALMNATLQPRGITATMEVRQGDLHIFFVSDLALPQSTLVDFTQKGLVKLGVVSFPAVWIYAYSTGEDLPLWIESIPIAGAMASDETGSPASGRSPRRSTAKFPISLPWLWAGLLACGSFAVGGLGAWFMQSILPPSPATPPRAATATDGESAATPTPAEQQAQAKTYLVKMNQAQQAFYAKNNRFAASLEELERSAAMMSQSYTYSYKLTVPTPNQTDLTGTPMADGLKSFRATVWVPRSAPASTQAALCESSTPSKIPPTLIKTEDTGGQCPKGATPVSGP